MKELGIAAAAAAALFTVSAVLVWPAAASEEEAPAKAQEEDAVIPLTDANFDVELKKTSRVLVEFYAPWCGHCKALEPEYKQAAKQVKDEQLTTMLAKVDVTEEKELAQRYEIKSMPTIIYFVDGRVKKSYEGARTASAIAAWVRKAEMPLFTTLAEGEEETFFKNTTSGEFALVAKVVKKSARAKAVHAAVEEQLADYETAKMKFGVVYLPKSADPKTDASLTLLRPGFTDPDPERLAFDGNWTGAAIAKWAKIAIHPTIDSGYDVAKHAPTAVEALGKDGTVLVLLHVEPNDQGAYDEAHVAELRAKVSAKLVPLATTESAWLFTVVAIKDLGFATSEQFGVNAAKEHAVMVLQGTKKYKVAGGDVTSLESVKALLQAVKAKKAKPFYKSGPVPDSPLDGDVTVVVGSTFEKIVFDPKKDVFVEFFAPWCQHCKKLEPVWAELATQAKHSGWLKKGVVVAKFDASANECEEEVSGYPHLVLYPAGKAEKKRKYKQVYSGARELDDLTDFLLENAKNLEGIDEAAAGDKKGKSRYSMVGRELERKKKAADKTRGSEL